MASYFWYGIVNNLYALPMFLSQIIAGFIGVLTAGMISAFMSTHDSYLLFGVSYYSRYNSSY